MKLSTTFNYLFIFYLFTNFSLVSEASTPKGFEQLIGTDIHYAKKVGPKGRRFSYKAMRTPHSFRDFDNNNLEQYYLNHLNEFYTNKSYGKLFPTYHEFFRTHLNRKTFSELPLMSILTKRDNTFIGMDLNPSLLYQVDYLLASKGAGAASGFGHSMIRLAFCDPSKVIKEGVITLSKDCLNHHNFHIVITYRANISEIRTSLLKGIFGGYESRLFLVPFNEIKNEYNDLELRDLLAYKLNLSENLKRRLVYRTLEQFWTYRGEYFFLSNNCATETASLIDSILWSTNTRISKGETPYGLVEELKKKKLISKQPIVYKSYEEYYLGYINELNDYLNLDIQFENWDTSDAKTRLNYYEQVVTNLKYSQLNGRKKRKTLGSLKLLEKRVLKMNDHKLMESFESMLNDNIFTQDDLHNVLSLGEISDNMNLVTENVLGIPESSSELKLERLKEQLSNYLQNLNHLYTEIFKRNPELATLKSDINNNLNYLSSQINQTKEFK